jgi:hypothetical protein
MREETMPESDLYYLTMVCIAAVAFAAVLLVQSTRDRKPH